MKGESATLEPLPNFPDGVEGSIVWRWMSRAVEEKSATILVVKALRNTASLKGRGTGFPLHFSAGGACWGAGAALCGFLGFCVDCFVSGYVCVAWGPMDV